MLARKQSQEFLLKIKNYNDFYMALFTRGLIRELILFDLTHDHAKYIKESIIEIFQKDFSLFRATLLLGNDEFRNLFVIYLGPDILKIKIRWLLFRELNSLQINIQEIVKENINPDKNHLNRYRICQNLIQDYIHKTPNIQDNLKNFIELIIDFNIFHQLSSRLSDKQLPKLFHLLQHKLPDLLRSNEATIFYMKQISDHNKFLLLKLLVENIRTKEDILKLIQGRMLILINSPLSETLIYRFTECVKDINDIKLIANHIQNSIHKYDANDLAALLKYLPATQQSYLISIIAKDVIQSINSFESYNILINACKDPEILAFYIIINIENYSDLRKIFLTCNLTDELFSFETKYPEVGELVKDKVTSAIQYFKNLVDLAQIFDYAYPAKILVRFLAHRILELKDYEDIEKNHVIHDDFKKFLKNSYEYYKSRHTISGQINKTAANVFSLFAYTQQITLESSSLFQEYLAEQRVLRIFYQSQRKPT